MPAVDQRQLDLVGVQAHRSGDLHQQGLPTPGELVHPGQQRLHEGPAEALRERLLGRLGGGVGVLVLLQREVPQLDRQGGAVLGAQCADVVQGGAAVRTLEFAPELEPGEGTIDHVPSVPLVSPVPGRGAQHGGREA